MTPYFLYSRKNKRNISVYTLSYTYTYIYIYYTILYYTTTFKQIGSLILAYVCICKYALMHTQFPFFSEKKGSEGF